MKTIVGIEKRLLLANSTRKSIHIKYDGIGFIPLEELRKKETA